MGYKFYNPSEDDVKGFKEITDIFVRSKFGSFTTDEDILILKEFKTMLEMQLKNKVGRISYYYKKYVRQTN